jgi:phosphoserine phosphatase
MSVNSWQVKTPISAIIFDCDGTLSAIEGIDELAKNNNATDIVQRLTQDAMGKSGMNVNLYQQRLDLVQPTQQQILELGEKYIAHCVPDVFEVIQLLKRLNKDIYIISAGLQPSVAMLGHYLNIPTAHIYAVGMEFNAKGQYVDFDRRSPLVNRNGKRVIVNELKKVHDNILYVGDGLNDLEVKDLVNRFIGYGGIYYRENIKTACEYYLTAASMSAMLPYTLTEDEIPLLNVDEKKLYQNGLSSM